MNINSSKMKKMNTYLWQITAKTNLHVGNEDSTSYGIIDKAVQRDVLTELPCINASSLKGAINEFCCSTNAQGNEVMSAENRKIIFGSDKKGDKKSFIKGQAVFYDANILFLPVQDDEKLFKYATCAGVQKILNDRLSMFASKVDDINQFKRTGNREYKKLSDSMFTTCCNDENLPIIARNVLENGESKNLWYEQVVPAETVFYAIIQEPEGDVLRKAINGKIIQIGANATVGYGYCKFECVEMTKL